MPEPILTVQQANQLLTKVFGPNQKFQVMETRHGWVAQAILSQEELDQDMGLGLGNYVLNKQTGVVTAHRSLPPDMIGEEFDEAIETGQPIQGGQVYPPLRRIHLWKTFEDPQTVQYQVQVTDLAQPNHPETTELITINKETLYFHPSGGPLSEATAWAEMLSRTTGTWPIEETIER